MNISFYIHYCTAPGERLFLLGSLEQLGADDPSKAIGMHPMEAGGWIYQCEVASDMCPFSYVYLVRNEEGVIRYEPWERRHEVVMETPRASLFLYDHWRLLPVNALFYGSSAFTRRLFAEEMDAPVVSYPRTLLLRLFHPCVRKGEQLAIAGNQPCVGSWSNEGALLLSQTAQSEWEVRLNADEITFPFEYKFFVCDKERRVLHWEKGENRSVASLVDSSSEVVVLSDYPYRDATPLWKGAGVMVPLFSLRSERSFGVGDFHDLKLLVEWAAMTNQCLIQLLPINDTSRTDTWRDSYPYSGISVHAIHPIYLSLEGMVDPTDPTAIALYQERCQALNAKSSLDYESVIREKRHYIKAYFDRVGDEVMASVAFKSFFHQHQGWLTPYAAFCYLRDQYGTADFSLWGDDALYDASRIEQLFDEKGASYPQVALTLFTQYLLDQQLKEVVDYARCRGVVLKGDLPIGVHRQSVETWTERGYFNLDGQAGAPPDDFSAMGQNWSFPTYNDEEMARDGYRWWKKRLFRMADYFDCFRIDHILGFFRIWEIPLDYIQGLCGHFNPALPYTIEEVESFGFRFHKRYAVPHIHRDQCVAFFGELSEQIVESYLEEMGEGFFRLKPFCDTQRKIEVFFCAEEMDQVSSHVKERLLMLANQLLFLPDPSDSQRYHPRIAADQSLPFQLLSPQEQDDYRRLYHHFFYERHETLWQDKGVQRLTPLVRLTEMLVCGEDLGMIPAMVHPVMQHLQVLTLELGRLSKQSGSRFTDLQKIPYGAVCTTSTHDMPTLRGWWEEEDEACRSQYYHQILQQSGAVPTQCTSLLATQIVTNHLDAVAMLAIFPLQDWLAIDDVLRLPAAEKEQVNIPADPDHYWCYRMHLTLESLIQADAFNQKIRFMIAESGRS